MYFICLQYLNKSEQINIENISHLLRFYVVIIILLCLFASSLTAAVFICRKSRARSLLGTTLSLSARTPTKVTYVVPVTQAHRLHSQVDTPKLISQSLVNR